MIFGILKNYCENIADGWEDGCRIVQESLKEFWTEDDIKEEEETDFVTNVTHILSIIKVRSSAFPYRIPLRITK